MFVRIVVDIRHLIGYIKTMKLKESILKDVFLGELSSWWNWKTKLSLEIDN